MSRGRAELAPAAAIMLWFAADLSISAGLCSTGSRTFIIAGSYGDAAGGVRACVAGPGVDSAAAIAGSLGSNHALHTFHLSME
jgi:hypothetical protein